MHADSKTIFKNQKEKALQKCLGSNKVFKNATRGAGKKANRLSWPGGRDWGRCSGR